MVAPADPKGINKVGAPKSINYSIDSWGFVHGRFEKRRQYLGFAIVFGGGLLLVVTAWLLTRVGDNFHATVPNEWYRGAQMSENQLVLRIHENGIRSVLRLVGTKDGNTPGYEADVAATETTGVELFVTSMPTSRLPYRSELIEVFKALDRIHADASLRPVLVHCRHGSDRTGLVSAIWLHDYRDVPLAEARRQLAFFPYMHFAPGHMDTMGAFLNRFQAYADEHPGARIQDWVRDHYWEEREGREPAVWTAAN